jgi:P4 family phage/plasmid primase-like protien
MTQKQYAVKPGEIRLDLLPIDWPFTPLGAQKDPYVLGWQKRPFSADEIEKELLSGKCKAVGLHGGPVFNHPYGLVWVDVDGASIYKLVEEISGLPFNDALPPTLTILSGKPGRERKLYRVEKRKHDSFLRNKYVWHSKEVADEKLEILWTRHQGVLMGLHPETDGYFTAEEQGFEWIDRLPEMPAWLLHGIVNKNVQQGKPPQEITRRVTAGSVVQSTIGQEREIQNAKEAAWALPPEVADDYDLWIIVGQTLHSVDESLLDEWDAWSRQSEKYQEGECHRRWLSFTKGGGRTAGTLFHMAKENGWSPSQDYRAFGVDDETLEHVSQLVEQIDEDLKQMASVPAVVEKDKAEAWSNTHQMLAQKTSKKKEEKEDKRLSSDVIADRVFDMYTGNLRYSQPHGQFFLYDQRKGLWEPLTKVEMLGSLREKLKTLVTVENDKFKGFSTNLMNDIYSQLQSIIPFDEWYDGSRYLLFTNGVLDVETKDLMEFQRDLYLTQQMPYDYDPAATCEEIIKWLKHTQHDSYQRAQVLRAWLRATLLGRHEIQKFVEIVGPGKSGKSTYANLAVALVGKQNTYSTDFENLEKNRFEAASYMGKKLLLFQDVDRWGGSVSKLKAITGGDWIRSERKYQTESQDPFQYHGMVMITANEAIQSTDYTSGLARRRLTIPFDRPFAGGQAEQKELIKFDNKGNPQGVFAPLLAGLVNWLLDMTEEDMRSYLMETGKNVSFFQRYEKTQSLRSNPLLDWMDHKVVFDPNVSSPVGFCKVQPGGSSGYYDNWDKWLYASYAEFCRSCNVGIMSRGRFEPLFLDICRHQLKINVYGVKNSKGLRIVNAVVRDSNKTQYESYPSIVEVAANPEKYRDFYGVSLSTTTDEIMDENATDM